MLKDAKAFPGFSVDDIRKAKDFYGGVLGLDVEEEQDGMLTLHTGGADVFVYAKPDHKPATFTILNFPVGNLDQEMEELTGRGVRFERYDREDLKTDERGVLQGDGAPRIAWFKDPAGNVLSVLETE